MKEELVKVVQWKLWMGVVRPNLLRFANESDPGKVHTVVNALVLLWEGGCQHGTFLLGFLLYIPALRIRFYPLPLDTQLDANGLRTLSQ